MNTRTATKKLAWRCRRGTRELDRLVSCFFKHHYRNTNRACQAAFATLLELPDPDLYAVLTATQAHDDPAVEHIKQLIAQSRHLRHNHHD